MHSRKEIIKNQKEFQENIISWLKSDFKRVKRELLNIDTTDKTIKEAQKKLLKKAKGIKKIDNEIKILFIHENNIYPKFFAWWNDQTQEVEIHKYINEA